MKRLAIACAALITAAACSVDSSVQPELRHQASVAAARSTKTTYAYTVSGDISTAAGFPAGTAATATGSPFTSKSGITVTNVSITLGVPTGDIAACKTGDGIYDTTFGENANRTWTGSITFHKTGTIGFNGTRVGGTEEIQFSMADATGGAVQSPGTAPGSYTLSLSDARLFIGGNSTSFDGKYRCVDIAFTATP